MKMNWKTLFVEESTITPEETRSLMETDSSRNYQLLDVRQPKEYEQSHIPGAILIPLSELNDNLFSLDRDRPVIVYCRSGVRSKAACQTLMQAGFTNCLNMTGGILKWSGAEAEGDQQFGLDNFIEGDFSSSFSMAYTMESNLKKFYILLADNSSNSEEKDMLTQMAQLEDGHMAKLLNKYNVEHHTVAHADSTPDLLEGGVDSESMKNAIIGQLGSAERVLQLGMKLEAQALDLYNRLAREHRGSDVSMFFEEMAYEELTHLRRLSKQLDKILES